MTESKKVKEVKEVKTKKQPKKAIILTNKNLKFGIYWIDANKKREFNIVEFDHNKVLCQDFENELKKGNIKVEYR